MVTQPVNTAKIYVLSASSACSVTLTHLGKSTTWQALPEDGGQTTFIVPAGAVAEISDENVLLSPLPFKIAPGADSRSVGGTAGGNTRHLLPFNTKKSNALLSGLSYNTLCASAGQPWLKQAFRDCVAGDTAYIDLSAFSPAFTFSAYYFTPDTPLFAGDSQTYQIRLGEGVNELKRMVLKIGSAYRSASGGMLLCNADVDFTVISQTYGLWSFERIDKAAYFHKAKSLTVISTNSTISPTDYFSLGRLTTSADLNTRVPEDNLNFPIKFIAPAFTGVPTFIVRTRSSGNWMIDDDSKKTRLDITAALPSLVSSFSFYPANFNSVDNLVYLMDNLGTPAAGSTPQLTFGLDAALVDTSAPASPVYADADLQAAVVRFRAKGWLDLPQPLTEA